MSFHAEHIDLWANVLPPYVASRSLTVGRLPVAAISRAFPKKAEASMIERYLRVRRRLAPCGVITSAILFALGTSSLAQQVTGAPGSPGATTTIDGKQLPPPPPKFGGVIEEKASESKPWWAPRVVPPKGAPNVLLIMTDDVGFAAPFTFGGV